MRAGPRLAVSPSTAGEIPLADLDKALAVTDRVTWPPGNAELESRSHENQAARSFFDADRPAKDDSGFIPEVHGMRSSAPSGQSA